MILVFAQRTIQRALIVLYGHLEVLYNHRCVSCDHLTWLNACKWCVSMTLVVLGHLDIFYGNHDATQWL